MGRAFTLSLAWHAALILSFLVLSGTRAPLRIVETVRPVRLVTYIDAPRAPAAARAPRLAVPAAPPAPAARPAPPRAAAVPEEDAEPETAVARPAPRAVTVPKILVPVRPPTPAAPSPSRPAPAAVGAPALQERLSRRLAATTAAGEAPRLASLPAVEETPAPRSPGRPASAAAAALPPGSAVVPVGDFPHAWYLALLKEQIYTRWTPPSEFFTGARGASALVGFRIERGGQISRVTLRQGSGSARYDQSALAAVQSLPRVPALPPQYAEESLDVVIRFQNEE